MRRLLILLVLAIPLVALAQDSGGGIDVVDVSGPLDRSALEFLNGSIIDAAETGQDLVVFQINSRAVLDGEALDMLLATMEAPPVPVAVWVGPAPATAYGGVQEILEYADHSALAPGSKIGLREPRVAGTHLDHERVSFPLDAEVTGYDLEPTIRQYLQNLNGRTFITGDGPTVVETVERLTESGETGVTTKPVTFKKPGLVTRFFRLGVVPEAAFFFLMVGLAIVTFEFFAVGPGVAAGVAVLSLLIAGWGIVSLPVNPWALASAFLGWALLTASYQKGGVVFLTGLGALLMQVGGMGFVRGSGQIDPRWWLILPTVAAVLFFFLLAMPTVQRARFSTQTIGRQSLVGKTGAAVDDFDPDGVVEIDGARWRASGHREAGISAGAPVTVTGVDGLYLEVEAIPTEA